MEMFFTSNEIVMRQFKREQKRFLQLGCNDQLELGDIFEWDGWHLRITKKETLSRLGIDYIIQENNTVDDCRKITSESRVSVSANCITFSGKSRYIMQSFKSKHESIDTLDLCDKISERIIKGNLQWNRKWIVVTEICHAESYSRFISGTRSANVQFDTADLLVANIADPNISVMLSNGINTTDSVINRTNCKPYIRGVKYRKDSGSYSLIPYAANWKDFAQDLVQ